MLLTDLDNSYMACRPGDPLAPFSEQLDSSCLQRLAAANPAGPKGGSAGLASDGDGLLLCAMPLLGTARGSGGGGGACVERATAATLARNATAVPGRPLNFSVAVVNGFGELVTGGADDARVWLAVQAEAVDAAATAAAAAEPRGTALAPLQLQRAGGAAMLPPPPSSSNGGGGGCAALQPAVLLGNSTQALRGVAIFNALTIFASPGDYWLRVSAPQRPTLRPLQLHVSVRSCIAGEHYTSGGGDYGSGDGASDDEAAGGGACRIGATCEMCRSPYYSFDPRQPCSLCAPGDNTAYCDGPVLIPANTYWQSSPRSNQVGAW